MADQEEYAKKLAALQQYTPFLENMMTELKAKGNREAQLIKIKSLHEMITDKRKKLKLETLRRCEEVLTNIYIKVNPQLRAKPLAVATKPESPIMTPASPSPPRDIIRTKPVTIPTEKVMPCSSRGSNYPKIDIYGSALIGDLGNKKATPSIVKAPDMSKPPISLDDLKTLEDDVNSKITAAQFSNASVDDLQKYREHLELQIQVDRVSSAMTPSELEPETKINHKPDKAKRRESGERKPKRDKDKDKDNDKPKKVVSTVDSTFGSLLSSLDEKLKEEQKRKEKRTPRDDAKSGEKENKKKDGSRRSSKEKSKKGDAKEDKKDGGGNSTADEPKKVVLEKPSSDGNKTTPTAQENESSKTVKIAIGDKNCEGVGAKTDNESQLQSLNKDKNAEKSREDVPKPAPVYKRLADKYNPKPKKHQEPDDDVDKVVKASIERDMKLSPVKMAPIPEPKPPPPPPASLVRLTMDKETPSPKPSPLPDILQKIFHKKPLADPRRQPTLSPISPPPRHVAPLISPPPRPVLLPQNRFQPPHALDFEPPMRQDCGPPPSPLVDFDHPDPSMQGQFNRAPNFNPGFNPRFPACQLAEPVRPVLNFMPPTNRFHEPQGYPNFVPNPQPHMDYFVPPNMARQPNFNNQMGPPMLTPEIPHYIQETKPQFYHDRQWGDGWDRDRRSRDPRSYREYREMKEREAREATNKDSGDKAAVIRDPRLNRPEPAGNSTKNSERGSGRSKEIDPRARNSVRPQSGGDWSKSRETFGGDKPSRYDSKFDRMYARNVGKEMDLARAKSQEEDSFMSPLDRLYARDSNKTGKGYGVQNFRIPKKVKKVVEQKSKKGERNEERNEDREDHDATDVDAESDDGAKVVDKEPEEDVSTSKAKAVKEEPIKKVSADEKHNGTPESPKFETREDVKVAEVSSSPKDPKVEVIEAASSVDDFVSEYDREYQEEQKKQNLLESVAQSQPPEPESKPPEDTKEPSSSHEPEVEVTTDHVPEREKSPPPAADTKAGQATEQKTSEPTEQNILAHFFENLLKSKNKNDKKTALFSLIETFSDSFTDKELKKITKIIKTNDDDSDETEDEDVAKKKPTSEPETPKTVEAQAEDEVPVVGSTTEEFPGVKAPDVRRVSTTTEEGSVDAGRPAEEESETSKTVPDDSREVEISQVAEVSQQDDQPLPLKESVTMSVGERTKSRKRTMPVRSKKKMRTELDWLHEDIQDMFIRDGVLTATGKRMCRMLKNDPNVLNKSSERSETETDVTETPKKPRKKSGPKPKPKINAEDMKSMKSVRVLLAKMPDPLVTKSDESPKRMLRSRASRKSTVVESEDEATTENKTDNELSQSVDNGLESEYESSGTEEEENRSQTSDTSQKIRVVRRRRGKRWASGIVNRKKKKPAKSKENSPERTASPDADNGASLEADLDKFFVEPDKTYYIDKQTKIKCKLCDHAGLFLTSHYLKEHPHSEILCSRFSPDVAQKAIADYDEKGRRYESIVNAKMAAKYRYSCRMCGFTSSTLPLFFYEHISTHTGEYRHQCGICFDFYAANGKTLSNHFINVHPDQEKKAIRNTYNSPIIFGYVCGECNFVQLIRKNVEEHINIYHLGEKPRIVKVNMSNGVDPILERFEELVEPEETPSEAEEPVPPKTITKKKPAKAKSSAEQSETPVAEETQSVPTKRKPGPKSKTMKTNVPVVVKESPVQEVPEKIPTPVTVRRKPGPKSRKRSKSVFAKVKKSVAPAVDISSLSEADVSHSEDNATSDSSTATKVTKPPHRLWKKRSSLDKLICQEKGEDLDSIIALSSRGRAAKEKATVKLKSMMEANDTSPKKKSDDVDAKTKKDEPVSTLAELPVEDQKVVAAPPPKQPSADVVPPKEETKTVSENVFTCSTDILQEESKKIEEERLKTMDELNKSIGSRTSKLDFVDKLCTRLNNEQAREVSQVAVKEEPKDNEDEFRPETPMPVLEKQLPVSNASLRDLRPLQNKRASTTPAEVTAAKKPTLEEDVATPPSTINFRQNKTPSLFSNTIKKLQGKINEASQGGDEANTPTTSNADGAAVEDEQTVTVGGLVKATKTKDTVVFSCHADNCYVSTKDKMVFQLHCKFGHKDFAKEDARLCEKCGIYVTTTADTNLMENLYDHLIFAHSSFDQEDQFAKPSILRMRKLSGDKLSVKREPELGDDDNANGQENTVITPAQAAPPKGEESAANEAAVEFSEDNPFSFKIAEVMSLAEIPKQPPAAPPPLTPISSPKPQSAAMGANHIVVKEARLTQAELARPRKAPKAMTKFVETPAELYKCPHYYCMFTTNFRAFLERHLKAHKTDTEVMIPCVYCDMKTPWEHVPMHIDIRHAHCRYACSYCLYRSWLKEYVCLHQDHAHCGQEYSVIQLPVHKSAKKFAVADSKTDLKALCEAFKCLCKNREGEPELKKYLFENEFEKHLLMFHRNSFIPCSYKGCTHRVQGSLMMNHWALFHGVCTYQCAYCKMNSREVIKMYQHFAQFHQWMQPDILVRQLEKLSETELGYTDEAFEILPRITTLPPNVLCIGKPKGMKAIKMIHLKTNANGPNSSVFDSDSGTSVLKTSPSNTLTLKQVDPGRRLTNNIKILVATTGSSAGSNILLVPAEGANNATTTTLTPTSSPTNNVYFTSPRAVNPTKCATTKELAAPNVRFHIVQAGTAKNSDTKPASDLINNKISILPLKAAAKEPAKLSESAEPAAAAPLEHVDVAAPTGENDPALTAAPSAADDDDFLDDPLFEGINVGPDSPPEDPLSITPTLNTAVSPVEDPLLFESPPAKESPAHDLQAKVFRSNSLISNSDEESDGGGGGGDKTKKTGLTAHQLYRCAECHLGFGTPIALKNHLVATHESKKGQLFKCAHCDKFISTVKKLMYHIRCHGELRFTCSLCCRKFPMFPFIKSHMKLGHNISQTTLVPLVPTMTNFEQDYFVVRPISALPSGTSKESSAEAAKPPEDGLTFTPDKIMDIPIRQIFPQNVKCGLCNYQTKVRVNIVRHLQMHENDNSVPDTAPVNPVPCLEKNEKMFDKMINLAASSITERMGGAKHDKEKNDENIPEFVPTHCRFVCCAQGCSYLCPEEANLKHHLLALHSDETDFTCAHCKRKITPTDADGIIKHFKLHGLSLYKCKYCNFVHNLKHKVERHAADVHPDQPVVYVAVRAMDSEPNQYGTESSPQTSTATVTKQSKPWRCCMCKYKCPTEDDIRGHIVNKHDIDAQFKCTLCRYKSNEKDSFDGHFKDEHPSHDIDIIFVYRKVEEETPKEEAKAPFDTTPLWQRDRPRVRHIRGILFDESTSPPAKSPKKTQKSSPAAAATVTSSPSTSSKNIFNVIDAVARGETDESSDEPPSLMPAEGLEDVKEAKEVPQVRQLTEKCAEVIVIDDEDEEEEHEEDVVVVSSEQQAPKSPATDLLREAVKMAKLDEVLDSGIDEHGLSIAEYDEQHLKDLFGDVGLPNNKQWKCPKCLQFKSKRVTDFIFHLYKDYNVFRYRCKACKDESITYKYMLQHIKIHWNNSIEIIETIPPNLKLETWIQMVIREQSILMIGNYQANDQIVTEIGKTNVSCIFCKHRFPNFSALCRHTLNHWVTKPYACCHCGETFYAQPPLLHHQKTAHPGLKLSIEPVSLTVGRTTSMCDENFKKRFAASESVAGEFSGSVAKRPRVETDAWVIKIDSDDEQQQQQQQQMPVASKDDQQVFVCDACVFIADSETEMNTHMPLAHGVTMRKFRVLSKSNADNTQAMLGCNVCDKVLPEVELRVHFTEAHSGGTVYSPYGIFRCDMCQCQFRQLMAMKMHCAHAHRGKKLAFQTTSLENAGRGGVGGGGGGVVERKVKMYRCPLCPYTYRGSHTSTVRCHLGTHLKKFRCELCDDKFKSVADAYAHHNKAHAGKEQAVIELPEVTRRFQSLMRSILRRGVVLDRRQGVAKKSTSSTVVKPVSAIATIDGVQMTMPVDELSEYMNLHTYVDLSGSRVADEMVNVLD